MIGVKCCIIHRVPRTLCSASQAHKGSTRSLYGSVPLLSSVMQYPLYQAECHSLLLDYIMTMTTSRLTCLKLFTDLEALCYWVDPCRTITVHAELLYSHHTYRSVSADDADSKAKRA